MKPIPLWISLLSALFGIVELLIARNKRALEIWAHGEMLNDGFHGLNVPNEEQAWMILSFMYSLSRYPYARRITFLA